MARPSPVPLPRSLVVKKGSKIRARSSGGMPLPVSLTVKRTPAVISTRPNLNMNVLTDESGKEIGYFHNDLVKVEDRRLEDLLAAESQQLADEGLRAVRALHDFRYFAAET